MDLLAQTLVASKGHKPFAFAKKDDTTFVIASVFKDSQTIYFTVTQGSKGIESRIDDNGKIVFERKTGHTEHIDFRNVVIFPAHGKFAVLLTERIGNRGVASFLVKLISDTLRQNFHEVTTVIKALTTAADLKNTNLALRSLDFQFPDKNDPSAKLMDLSNADGSFSLRWRFRKARKLSNYTDATGAKLDADKIFAVLNPGLAANGLETSGERLKELGVTADLHVTLPSGNHRSFTLGMDEGPALAYTLEPKLKPTGDGTVADRFKPEDDDFLAVCKDAVSDVAGNFGIGTSSATYCVIPDPGEEVVVPSTWKVVWNVPDHIVPDSA
ncbi:hypothetical protein [Subtercola boreus]|uniref:hypothetical protein n=1 Tax=Subtercola boreus TaxID=120213 RepID=UPI001153DB35|nr:hypothetical protein [Subtercola boreus]TQL55190.1 hypothetical protein FB464_2748 [Subtercola boreus]